MRRVSVSIFGVLAMVLASLTFTPSVQAAEGTPVITPAEGSSLQDWDGTFSILANGATPGYYTATLFVNEQIEQSRETYVYANSTPSNYTFFRKTYFQDNVRIVLRKTSDGTLAASSSFYVEGYDQPQLVSPQSQSLLIEDKTFTVSLDFSDARPGTYEIGLTRGSEYNRTREFVWDPANVNPLQAFSFPVSTGGEYSLNARISDYYFGYGTFYLGNPVDLTIKSVTPQSFYPTVRDGFRDSTTIKFGVSLPSFTEIKVRNDRNRVVASDSLDTAKVGRTYSFTWNGRGVEPGKYFIDVKSRDNEFRTVDTAKQVVFVKSDFVNEQGTETAKGTQTTSRSKSGPCYFSGYSGELSIDCWGFFERASAEARYGFRIPSNATNLRYSVRGLVKCCDGGVISKGIKRTSATNAFVYVRLTGSRAYDVRKVALTYNYKRKR